MAKLDDGYALCNHITEIQNNLITTKGKQLDKNEDAIWGGFLHEIGNYEWDCMFTAFKDAVDKHNIFLTHHQQRKYDEAYTTFKRDSALRDKCMDILIRSKNTRTMAWSMIMVIREVFNEVNKIKIDNVDAPVTIIKSKTGKQHKIEIRTTKEATTVTVFHNLFDIDD